MKTPRDILLAQHHAAEPKLDAIRRLAVAELNHQDTKAQSWAANLVSWCLGGSNLFWRELILPSRRIWSGLAAIWILIAVVNVSQRDHSMMHPTKSSSVLATASFRDQQKLLNELLADRSVPGDIDRPRIFSPKPRTETMNFFTV